MNSLFVLGLVFVLIVAKLFLVFVIVAYEIYRTQWLLKLW